MTTSDPQLQKQVKRLHRLTVYGRWLLVVFCWLSLGTFGIWGLRDEIKLWYSYFTWSALRYGITYNIVPAMCLFFCIAITGAVLTWQSRNILIGISRREQQKLENQVKKIQAKGPNHLLWKWVIKDSGVRSP